MNYFLPQLIPATIILIIIFIPAFIDRLRRQRLSATKRSPLVNNLLRGPGESLRAQLEDTRINAVIYMAMTPMTVLSVYAGHISESYINNREESVFRYVSSSLLAIAVTIFFCYKFFTLKHREAKLRQGYEGEVAVGQALNQLMRQGAIVFHDVPGEGFNIDHVLVAPNGVFAIETKARMKPKRNKGKEDAQVVFDGNSLSFPTWTEQAPIEQATAQARWLAHWLSSATGETIEVKAGIALPGWYIENNAKSSNVLVFNATNPSFLLKWTLKEPLPESLRQRINHQLDQRCRDVEPTHDSKNAWTIGKH